MNEVGKADTPNVEFLEEGKIIVISGNSYPEDCESIYLPILQFVTNYKGDVLKIACYFNLIGSSSVVYMSKIIAQLAQLKNNGVNVLVDWKYDELDEELCELGEKFEIIHKVPFNFVPIDNED